MNTDALQLALNRLKTEIKKTAPAMAALESHEPGGGEEDLYFPLQLEQLMREEIDEHCRFWIAHGTWPARMKLWTAALVWERLDETLKFAEWVFSCGLRAPNKTESEILELLLIDTWLAFGVHRRRARYLEQMLP